MSGSEQDGGAGFTEVGTRPVGLIRPDIRDGRVDDALGRLAGIHVEPVDLLGGRLEGLHHVVAGRVYSEDAVAAKQAETLQGDKIRISVNGGPMAISP